ncbi:hypothetical protein B0H14DRAFT_3574125 [Mycena olivaceomarginata]|nr:hypothetical protein B0H14DRAFT_3574125 [Mycena olivaceomarginata]
MDIDKPPASARGPKRPRDGSDDAAASGAPPAKRTAAPVKAVQLPLGPTTSKWMRHVQRQCPDTGARVPPLTVLEGMEAIRTSALSSHDRALAALQKALVAEIRFDQASENGAVPSLVANAMKMPAPQLLQDTPSLDEVEAVAAAREKAVSDLNTARASASAYMRAVFGAQAAHYRAASVVDICATSYTGELSSYAKDIIERREGPEADVKIWDKCIDLLRSEIVLDLQNLGYDYAARLRKEELEKEAKASAVAITRADAETAKAARTIEDLLKEATAGADTRIKDLEKQLQQLVASGRATLQSRTPHRPPPRRFVAGSSKPATAKKEYKGPNVPAAAAATAAGGRSGSVKFAKKTPSNTKGKGKAVADNHA